MATKIEEYKLKPLRKLYRPYFSPNFNSYEMGYALSNFLINNQKIYKYYLILINIHSKFLFALPIKNNITPSIEITKILIKDVNNYLGSLGDNLKINNIRADSDSKFEKIIKNNNKPKTIKLNVITYKKNVFLNYLESKNITLYLISK
jgi:hypothetical protein